MRRREEAKEEKDMAIPSRQHRKCSNKGVFWYVSVHSSWIPEMDVVLGLAGCFFWMITLWILLHMPCTE